MTEAKRLNALEDDNGKREKLPDNAGLKGLA